MRGSLPRLPASRQAGSKSRRAAFSFALSRPLV